MTKSLQKSTPLPEATRKEMARVGLELAVGDLFIRNENGRDCAEVFRINRIKTDKKGKIEYIGYGRNNDWEATDFKSEYGGWNSLDQAKREIESEEWVRVTPQQIKEYRALASKAIAGELTPSDLEDNQSDAVNSETAIVGKANKSALLTLQKDLEAKKQHAELIARFVGREMEQKRRELDKIKEKMYGVVAQFQKKITKIMRVITTIELYLGIEEELFCIQEGEKAPADTTIHFRQALLYMDEEIGHWKDGGLDFRDIKWFDHWLVKKDNYKKCIPEEKGMVVFRPRRHKKDYQSDDWVGNAIKNEANELMTYILVRNGECLYRIYTDKITILPRLFPKRKELQEMMDKIASLMKDGRDWEVEEKKDKVEDMTYQYRKRAFLMQGLIDRTEIFHPLPAEKVSIFNLDELGDKVRFIYDDEATLPSGRLSFWDWHKKINESIRPGSRVLCTGYLRDTLGWKREDIHYNRLFYYTRNYPAPPVEGLFTVEEFCQEKTKYVSEHLIGEIAPEDILHRSGKTREGHYLRKEEGIRIGGGPKSECWPEHELHYIKRYLTIRYNPKDEVRKGGWGSYEYGERKNRIRWRIYKTDEFILNYDQISLDDIDFYLNSRVDRPNYLEMMPLLEKIKAHIIEEQGKEKHFIDMLYGAAMSSLKKMNEEQIRKRITDSIEWWKYKNKIKRAITKDDELAYRMILRRVKSPNYESLKKLRNEAEL